MKAVDGDIQRAGERGEPGLVGPLGQLDESFVETRVADNQLLAAFVGELTDEVPTIPQYLL
ncbi:hypothetical protein [Rhizobium indicum]|uniref:Transposase n=1 Tax=Rhizobium indicum TaxID=2583231 RepID=A0ABX6PP27_9HYPH|nr:hypothetical protein [Rhizobium indicum]QKK20436.1 hypothetical protein FFM53_029025 [Rhizobium indicum]